MASRWAEGRLQRVTDGEDCRREVSRGLESGDPGGGPRKGLFQEMTGPWEEVQEGWQRRPIGKPSELRIPGERG